MSIRDYTYLHIYTNAHTYSLFSKCGLGTYKELTNPAFACRHLSSMLYKYSILPLSLSVCLILYIHIQYLHYSSRYNLFYSIVYVVVLCLRLLYFLNCNQELELYIWLCQKSWMIQLVSESLDQLKLISSSCPIIPTFLLKYVKKQKYVRIWFSEHFSWGHRRWFCKRLGNGNEADIVGFVTVAIWQMCYVCIM